MRADGMVLYWEEDASSGDESGSWRLTKAFALDHADPHTGTFGQGYDFVAHRIPGSLKYRSCVRDNGWGELWKMEFFEFARDSGNVGVGLDAADGALETKSAAAVAARSANFRGTRDSIHDTTVDSAFVQKPPTKAEVRLVGGHSTFEGVYLRDSMDRNRDVFRRSGDGSILFWNSVSGSDSTVMPKRPLGDGSVPYNFREAIGNWRLASREASGDDVADPGSTAYGGGSQYAAYNIPERDKYRSATRENGWGQLWAVDFSGGA
jgi:hypothetical protein